MTFDNLCSSCTNIGCEFQSGIVRTKCAFYMPPHIESDNCGNYVVMQPTVNVLDKIKAEIEQIIGEHNLDDYDFCSGLICARNIIDKYKTESEDKK